MTESGCKIKKAAIISSILSVTAVIVTLVGAQILVSWWELIHCSSAPGVNHSPGGKPDKENYSTAGNSVSQCHGTPGELGSARAVILGPPGMWVALSILAVTKGAPPM